MQGPALAICPMRCCCCFPCHAVIMLQAKARKAVVRQAKQAVEALTRPEELDTLQVGHGVSAQLGQPLLLLEML